MWREWGRLGAKGGGMRMGDVVNGGKDRVIQLDFKQYVIPVRL